MALGEWKDKITIQKSVAGNDKAGNHVLEWQNYYTCHAYVNNLSGSEYLFFVKHFSLKKAFKFPFFIQGNSLLSAGTDYASWRIRACSIR